MTKITDRRRNARILLIEDNSGDVILMRMAFKRAGLKADIVVAETAEQGLRIIRKEEGYTDLPQPDIVLLDLNLPRMDGHGFLKIIKAEPEFKKIPVIILSSSSADEDIVASYDNHANGYITKPNTLEAFALAAQNIDRYWFDFMQCLPDGQGGYLNCVQ